jgi:hypothetical protein
MSHESCAGVCGFWGNVSGLGGYGAPVGQSLSAAGGIGDGESHVRAGEQWFRPCVTGGLLRSRRHLVVEWVHCRAASLAVAVCLTSRPDDNFVSLLRPRPPCARCRRHLARAE